MQTIVASFQRLKAKLLAKMYGKIKQENKGDSI